VGPPPFADVGDSHSDPWRRRRRQVAVGVGVPAAVGHADTVDAGQESRIARRGSSLVRTSSYDKSHSDIDSTQAVGVGCIGATSQPVIAPVDHGRISTSD
jgi:hypothetical protein